jgi:uncharacterized protein
MEIIVRKPTAEELKIAMTWPIWEKEVSEFDWEYDSPETCLIIAGKATVTGQGVKASFGAGDYVVFPAGLKCKWKITEKIRKHYRFG